MLKITVNQHHAFEFDEKSAEGLDAVELRPGAFHVLRDGVSYNAEVVKSDAAEKTFSVKINGRLYEVKAQDRFDLLLHQLGMSNANSQRLKDLKAPMPGLILDIKVTDGQTVQKGDPLLILEAMKMENVIKAPADGTVKTVKVRKGESVEKGHVLLVF
ncbi:MAG: biotin/lipoyl-binding protein [Cytophagales bacterium]|jgi:biotin carboxyl carrier protein|nr:biotin/lipoyl-binding protein [Cytophagales bacterium]